MGDLKPLKAVAALSFTTDNIKNLVNKLCSFGVMTFGPVVSSTRLTKDEVVGTKELTERTSSNSIHCARFEVDEDSARDIFVIGRLQGLSEHGAVVTEPDHMTYLVEVHVHSLELKVRGAIIAIVVRGGRCLPSRCHLHARAVKAMLARDDLPVKRSGMSSKPTQSRRWTNSPKGSTNLIALGWCKRI